MTDEEKAMDALVEKAMCDLRDHFDNVLIQVSSHTSGKTSSYHRFQGNSSAVYGDAKRFVIQEEERFRQDERERIAGEKEDEQ